MSEILLTPKQSSYAATYTIGIECIWLNGLPSKPAQTVKVYLSGRARHTAREGELSALCFSSCCGKAHLLNVVYSNYTLLSSSRVLQPVSK